MPNEHTHTHIAIVIAILAILAPLLFRFFFSYWVVLLSIPFLLTASFLAGVISYIYLGLWIDRNFTRTKKKERVPAKPFAFSTPAAWQVVLTRSKWTRKSPQNLPYLRPEYPSASAAINDILIMIVRDFVLTWYTDISSSASFPSAVTDTIHGCLETLLKRLEGIDLPSLLVRRILPQLTTHVEQFRSSETALRGAGLERHLTQSEELDLLLASRYIGKGGSLHPAVDNLSTTFTKQTEEAHLRSLVDAVLPFILSPKDANSKAVRIVTRELVACSVLAPVTNLLSDPDFWNQTIGQVAGAAIRQQKLISRVRNVLEIQSSSRMKKRSKITENAQPETITIQSDPRQFDAFLRSISHCDSLLDARRVKNDIMGEIRRTRAVLASHENDDWIEGRRTDDVVTFLDRLYTAKRKVEKRIAILGGQDDSRMGLEPDNEAINNLSLREILINPGSLSYFMEFMDRRGRSLLVQFWLTVESFKNPLETVDIDLPDEKYEPITDPASAATLKEDLNMINDLYFNGASVPSALSSIPDKYVDAIRSYVSGSSSTSRERMARRSVMLAQRHVEKEMENDFESFRQGDLWFRAVRDLVPKQVPKESASAPRRPPLREHISSSTNALASFVHGLTQDLPRSQSNLSQAGPARTDSSLSLTGARYNSPAMGKSRFSTDSGRSSTVSTPGPSHAVSSKTPTSGNLKILMSGAAGENEDSPTRAPLFDESEDGQLLSADAEEAQRMAAIQAAVTDIIASEDKSDIDLTRPSSSGDPLDRRKYDDDATEGQRTRTIFADTQSAPHPGISDGEDDDDGQTLEPLELAVPGDLQLPHEIARLEDTIANNQSQDVVLDTLIRKAELTGDTNELRVLKKSKSALEREMRQLVFQKMQYEQQASASKLLPGKTKTAIVNSTSGDEDGKQVVRYLVEVQQPASGWVVARRYSEFLQMHQRLKERYAMVKTLEFPGKHLVTSLSTQMVDTRRIALEKYLQALLAIPVVCESQELRVFLSRDSPFIAKSPVEYDAKEAAGFPGQNIVRNVYRTFAESIDDVFFGPSMLDVMIGRLTRQAAEFAGIVGTAVNDEDLVAQALRASGKTAPEDTLNELPGDLRPLGGEGSTSLFASPICDFVLAIFELDKKNNWLRRQAIVIILQQVLGDTVERKVRESTKAYLDEVHVLSYINNFKDALWPGGQLRPEKLERTYEEKLRTRDDANRKLTALLPDVAANMMGRSNARRGARRIFAVLQNRRLNQHIVYTIMDEVFAALFPEANIKLTR